MSNDNITESGVQVGFVMRKDTRDFIKERAAEESRSFSAQVRIILEDWVNACHEEVEIDQPGPEL